MAAWTVSIANSLDETREFLWENQPDVLVIDAELPGLETVKIVKTLCCYFPIGQIILTIATPETAPAFESQKNIFLFDKKKPRRKVYWG